MSTKTLDVNTLTRYLGPAFVHPIEYWCKMWRLKDGGSNRHLVIKCPKEDHCVLYYTDKEGTEHRDALTTVSQLPTEYRKEKVGGDIAKSINSVTKLTFENIVALYGEPIIDPDIPFIYKWERGSYELTMMGQIFSFVQKGQDDRSTVSLFGQLPPDFRYALNTQNNKEGLKQTPVEMVNPKDVLKPTESSLKAAEFESESTPDVEYDNSSTEIPTVSTVADDGFDLNAALKGMGIETRTIPEDDDFPDDDDKFVSSVTKDANAGGPPPSNRKQMVVDVESEEVAEPAAQPEILEFNEPKPYGELKDKELTPEQLSERRSWRGRKGAHTAKMKKLAKNK